MEVKKLRDEIVKRYPDSQLDRVGSKTLEGIREQHPAAPADYLETLREVGWGGIGPSHYMLYSNPIPATEIFGEITRPKVGTVLLVGDDLAGWHHGYETSTLPWRFVAIDHAALGNPDFETAANLSDFLWWFLIENTDA